jgi:pimeloyl-ACP methyl ester carboxylesterase
VNKLGRLQLNIIETVSKLIITVFLLFSVLFSVGVASASANQGDSGADGPAPGESRYTFMIVHGASGGGWDWRTMDELLTARGHTVYRPTLTGLGEKMHLNNPEIDLTTHVTDIVNVILFEDLNEVVLVGHSYGGMVITGVMDRVPRRISHAVFLDAAVPGDGTSAMDLWPSMTSDHDVVDGIVHFSWLDPTNPVPGDVPQSLKTLTEPVSFNNPEALQLPATFIAFIAEGQTAEARAAEQSWQNAKARDWTIHTLVSDHNAQRSHPEELTALLEAAPKN